MGSTARFIADLHIHSKYSMACSKDCDLENLAWWARRKGITLVGTGDFTHPAWFDQLREMLVPAEPGVFRLRPDVERRVQEKLPAACRGPVRFMLSVEISTIYRRADRTRKVHHLIYQPDLASVERFNTALGRVGNLGSDGRPILGLDSRDLLEITLEASPDGYLVPAHVWTPWFSVLGSKSGFDAVADCYADLADHIFALETGLSSDPPMNWRISALDRYRLVSNSDAHSPPALGREATMFECLPDYYSVRHALETGEGFGGTLEFFPEEGKYHLDGHRKCGVRLEPAATRAADRLCPACGKPLTVGVLHRVEELADRPDGDLPAGAAAYRNFIQLPQILGEIHGVGPRTKTVDRKVTELVSRLGPELAILTEVPVDEVTRVGGELLGEAVGRLRRSEVVCEGGYDGEYGVIRLFQPDELRQFTGELVALPEPALFDASPLLTPPTPAPAARPAEPVLTGLEEVGTGLLDRLDTMQRVAASAPGGPMLIVAGPGTGKTRTLTHRIAYLIADLHVPPERCLAITFTRRAAEEVRDRLAALVPDDAGRVTVTTFHGLGLAILREHPDRAGLSGAFRVADPEDRLAAMSEVASTPTEARRLLAGTLQPVPADVRDRYLKALRAQDLVDVDELVELPVQLLTDDHMLAGTYRDRWPWVFVDEYQDVDGTQYELLRQLCPENGNLCAIGDPDQAIYGFRGADVGYFLRFSRDYPEARTARLTRNYRSTAPILAAAVQAIAPTTLVPRRILEPVRRDPEAPLVGRYAAASELDEADFVVRTIDQIVGGKSFHSLDSGRVDSRAAPDAAISFADIAVLHRTDALARPIVDALTRAGIPAQKRSHDRLSDRAGVAALIHELRVADPRGGSVTDRLRHAARSLTARPNNAEPADVHTAVEVLSSLAGSCGDDLDRFLTTLATGAEVDAWDPRADRVTLLTLHAAKGLEFPVVFLVGCEDGLLPHRIPGRPLDDAAVAEERRLFFVGATRARQRLYVSHATRRVRHGAERAMEPSPFLASIDHALFERLGRADPGQRRPRDRQLRLL